MDTLYSRIFGEDYVAETYFPCEVSNYESANITDAAGDLSLSATGVTGRVFDVFLGRLFEIVSPLTCGKFALPLENLVASNRELAYEPASPDALREARRDFASRSASLRKKIAPGKTITPGIVDEVYADHEALYETARSLGAQAVHLLAAIGAVRTSLHVLRIAVEPDAPSCDEHVARLRRFAETLTKDVDALERGYDDYFLLNLKYEQSCEYYTCRRFSGFLGLGHRYDHTYHAKPVLDCPNSALKAEFETLHDSFCSQNMQLKTDCPNCVEYPVSCNLQSAMFTLMKRVALTVAQKHYTMKQKLFDQGVVNVRLSASSLLDKLESKLADQFKNVCGILNKKPLPTGASVSL